MGMLMTRYGGCRLLGDILINQSYTRRHDIVTSLLVRAAGVFGVLVGGDGRCDKISVLNDARGLQRAVTNASISNGTFFRSVAKDMRTTLLFEI